MKTILASPRDCGKFTSISSSHLLHQGGAISCTPSAWHRAVTVEVAVRDDVPASLRDSVSISSLIADAEKDPERRARLERARMRLAKALPEKNQRSLKARRLALGLSQQRLAERAGMTQAQIANLEAMRGDPQVSTLAKLANVLGMNPSELVDDWFKSTASK